MNVLLPEWMSDDCAGWPTETIKPRHSNFLKKSLRNIKKTLAEDMASDKWAHLPGWLQTVNPAQKMAGGLIMLLILSVVRDYRCFLAAWLVTVVLMMVSRLPVLSLQKRIWGFIPLITLLISLPAALNIISAGTPLIMIIQGSDGGSSIVSNDIYFTTQGAAAVLVLFLRTGISLSVAALLVMTTPISSLFKTLRIFRIPSYFIFIVEMSYRYMILLLNLSIDMYEARRMRTVGPVSLAQQLTMLGSSIGSLFGWSMSLMEEVFQSMTARCYVVRYSSRQAEAGQYQTDISSPIVFSSLARQRSV